VISKEYKNSVKSIKLQNLVQCLQEHGETKGTALSI